MVAGAECLEIGRGDVGAGPDDDVVGDHDVAAHDHDWSGWFVLAMPFDNAQERVFEVCPDDFGDTGQIG